MTVICNIQNTGTSSKNYPGNKLTNIIIMIQKDLHKVKVKIFIVDTRRYCMSQKPVDPLRHVLRNIADVRFQRDSSVARHFDSDNDHSIQDLRA